MALQTGPSIPTPITTDQAIGAGGESLEHVALKAYVKLHPECVRAATESRCDIEYALPSGDEIDVLFRSADEWVMAILNCDTEDGHPKP